MLLQVLIVLVGLHLKNIGNDDFKQLDLSLRCDDVARRFIPASGSHFISAVYRSPWPV